MLTPTELSSEIHPCNGVGWRVVEAQYQSSSRKLSATTHDHDLLEDILEQSKPAWLPEAEHLDYLLKTPFRYKPSRLHGSRFRKPGEKEGVYYCCELTETAIAEFAYHRLKFFLDAPGVDYPRNEEALTIFSVAFSTPRQLDLTTAPLVTARQDRWCSNDYLPTQELAATARKLDVGAITYSSCRDPADEIRLNYALLTPRVFSTTLPQETQSWFLRLGIQEICCRRAGSRDRRERVVLSADVLLSSGVA